VGHGRVERRRLDVKCSRLMSDDALAEDLGEPVVAVTGEQWLFRFVTKRTVDVQGVAFTSIVLCREPRPTRVGFAGTIVRMWEQPLRKTVRAQTTIAAPAAKLFDCLADFECADVFIEGLEQLTPRGEKNAGEGAQFDAVLKVGPRTLRTTIEIAALEPGRSITWTSAGADGQSLIFDLRPEGGGTSVSLTVTYEEPGGIGGVLVAPFVEQTVRQRSTSALERLREHVAPVAEH